MKVDLPSFRSLMLFLIGLSCIFCLRLPRANGNPRDYFVITIVDTDTGRGVPLVELKTTHDLRFYSDSNGLVALNEPELMGQTVYFSVKSHGYEHAADAFGYRGVALLVVAGGRAQIKIKRVNIAERLYRITGAGIYRDTILAGQPAPIKQPLLNGQVMGQDTVMATPYRGKLYWFWGDTNRPSYPLGNFATSGATSLLPGQGGLDPSVGIDLTYWVDEKGFSKRMIPLIGFGGPIWVGGLFTLKDKQGQERLLTKFAHLKPDTSVGQNGTAIFNDDKAVFEPLRSFDPTVPLYPEGYPFRATVAGQPYLYFQSKSIEAFPLVRVRADMDQVLDPTKYEAFTCLVAGSRYDKTATRLDRRADGTLIYAWKADTPALSRDERDELIKAGKMKAEEALVQLREVDTDAPIQSHVGSVFWNPYRQRWIMISGQSFGASSFLGEIWFSEADTPVGPWVYATKIVTHDKYTFYNPTQHPFFDGDGGRLVYFEGTYTDTYSGNPDRTPRYNYNQIMYRLSLDDPRLSLPAPVYRLKRNDGTTGYALRETVAARDEWRQVQQIPFFAVPPGRARAGLIAVYGTASNRAMTLETQAPEKQETLKQNDAAPLLFYALPATSTEKETASTAIVPLYEYHNDRSGERWYSVDAGDKTPNVTRSALPLCRVWRNPSSVLALDFEAQPGT